MSPQSELDIEVLEWSELSTECSVLRDRNSAAAGDLAVLHCELDSHTNSMEQKQMTIDDLQEQLPAECKKTQLLTAQLAEEQNKLMLQQRQVTASSAVNSDLTVRNASLQRKLELAESECSNLKLSYIELCKKSDNDNGELQGQLLCLQNDYQLSVQSLNIMEKKNEILRIQCDQLTTENTNLKLKVLEQAEMQAKINKLEQALQEYVSALTESEKMTEGHLHEKDIVQNKLVDAENAKNCLQIELCDVTVLYRNSEKSLLEAQEKLVQRDKQIACCYQDTTHIRETLVALQHELKQEASEKTERKHQVKILKKEVENLKGIVTTQNGTVAEALAAKEENSKLAAALQLQTEHLTSEKVNLEQQIGVLEGKNNSLQKDFSVITDSYEHANKLITELQLRVDQLCMNEQNFSDQLSSLMLLCGQKDEVILQLNSEKEELSHSLRSLTQKAEADALERTANMRHISELEEEGSVVGDKMETLFAEKQLLVGDLNTCKDVIEQQKLSVADAKHESERCQKVILDFEKQSVCWRDEKYALEARIRELESCVASKEKEVQTMQEIQVMERTNIGRLPCMKNSESLEVSSKDMNNREEDHMLQKCELVQNLDAVEQKSEESEMDKDVYNDCTSVHNLCLESVSGNLAECQSVSINLQQLCNESETTEKHPDVSVPDITKKIDGVDEGALLTVEQTSSSEIYELECNLRREVERVYSSSSLEKVNLQPVMSENAEKQQSLESVKGALKRVDGSDSLSKNVAGNTSNADCDRQCNLNSAMGCENSSLVSDCHESIVRVVCVKDGSVNEEASSVEKLESSNDTSVKLTKVPVTAVAGIVSKRQDLDTQCVGKRRVIKRFTRLPQSAAASKHNIKPLYVCSSNIPSTQPAHSHDLNTKSVADAAKQLPDYKITPSNEEPPNTVDEIGCAMNLQDNTNNVPASVPADRMASDDACCTAACVADVCSVTEAASCKHLSACEQLSFPHAVSERSLATNNCSNHSSDTSNLNAETKCSHTQNIFVSGDNNSDNLSDLSYLALRSSNKRLNVKENGDDAKKFRLG